MENANPFVPAPPNRLCASITQELDELRAILAMIDSCLENIGGAHIPIPPHVPFEQLLDDFMNPPDELVMDDSKSDTEYYDKPLFSPFLDSDEGSYDGKKFVAYFDPFLPMNIITRKAYNTIMVEGLEILEDIGEFIVNDIVDVVMGRPFRAVLPILELSQRDLMSGLRYSHEKNKLMYKNYLNLGPEYQVDENMKEWLIRGHVSTDEGVM
ncbi:hypothetical protein Tco_0636992 [Tanacetum coccineum]